MIGNHINSSPAKKSSLLNWWFNQTHLSLSPWYGQVNGVVLFGCIMDDMIP